MSSTISSPSHNDFDAIIIGASIAGSICALELGNRGWRVAVVEKRQSLDHYKRICTHIIHPSGISHLKRLGLFDQLLDKSTLMTAMNIKHQNRSVYFPFKGKPEAANIERRDLDPVLKYALAKHSNIQLFNGYSLDELLIDQHRVYGTGISNTEGKILLNGKLVIAADGRNSAAVKLANGHQKTFENGRVALFSYFNRDDIAPETQESHVWSIDAGNEYVGYFPNKHHVLISWYLSAEKYQHYQNDLESLRSEFDQRAEHTRLKGFRLGERNTVIAIAKDTSPEKASTDLKGLVLVGDAKLAADPLTGVGCSWAMNSAIMLCQCLGNSNLQEKQLDRRVAIYNALHRVRFEIPSHIMSIASAHGRVFFNKPVFGLLSWLTGKRES